MEIKVDAYVWNKKTNKCFRTINATITNDDIIQIARDKIVNDLPMWFDQDVHEIREMDINESS